MCRISSAEQFHFISSLQTSILGKLRDLVRQPRYFPARIVLVNDLALRGLHQFGLSVRHRLQCRVAVATLDRFLDVAHRAAHLRAARLVDQGAAGNLARRLLGGSRIGHGLKYPSAVTARSEVAGVARRRPLKRAIDAAGFSKTSLRTG